MYKNLILEGVLLAAHMQSDVFILSEFLLESKMYNFAMWKYPEAVECVLHLQKLF
jgi:hypothetical protein